MKTLLALTLTFALFSQAFGQVQTARPTTTAGVVHVTPKPVVPFTLDMLASNRLDPAYAGHPAVRVADAIHKMLGVKKGDFESTADYNARRTAALGHPFLGGLTVSDTFAFVIPVASGGRFPRGIAYTFDADSSTVRIFVLPSARPLNGIGAPDYRMGASSRSGLDIFDLEFALLSNRTYQGRNAFGATVSVEVANMSEVGIAANPLPFLPFKREVFYRDAPIAIQLKMDNASAARDLPTLKALLVLKLSEPYLLYNFSHTKPTRDSPTEITMQSRYLHGDVLGIVFYSGTTGEIIARIPETFGKPSPALAPVNAAPTASASETKSAGN